MMARRRERLEQRLLAEALVARSTVADASAIDLGAATASAPAAAGFDLSQASSQERSALTLLVEQQRRIQSLEQRLASQQEAPAPQPVLKASNKVPEVVDLSDEDDGDEGATSSSTASLASSTAPRKKRAERKKGPLTAYALFLKDEWDKFMQHELDQQVATGQQRKVNPNMLVKAIAQKWKTSDQATLVRYTILANQEKERFEREQEAAIAVASIAAQTVAA